MEAATSIAALTTLSDEALAQSYQQFVKQTDEVQQMAFPLAGGNIVSSSSFGDSVSSFIVVDLKIADLNLFCICNTNRTKKKKTGSTQRQTTNLVLITGKKDKVRPPSYENVPVVK